MRLLSTLEETNGHNQDLSVSCVFFLSGAAGLIFELAWFHYCGLLFGNSIWATSIVLASFMGGLSLGSALASRVSYRIERVIRAYATLEAIVAVSGVALTYVLKAIGDVLAAVTHGLSAPWAIDLFRLAAAFTLLVIPTTAMGATLPLLAEALSRGRPGLGRALGWLYGFNTLGAVVGAVSAETILIRRLGVTGTTWVGGFMNLVAAGGALWIAHQTGEVQRPSSRARSEPTSWLAADARLLVCAGLAGANLMALEVVWLRFLAMLIVSSTLAVTLTVAVVLSGIGAGGIVTSLWLARRPHAASYLSAVALMAAFSSTMSYVGFQLLAPGPWAAEWYRILWFAAVLSLPTSLLSGVLFTLMGEAIKASERATEGSAGRLTMANTTGAMCGSLLAAFVVLPVLGMERAFFALALVYVAIGMLLLPGGHISVRSPAWRGWLVAASLASAALFTFPFGVMVHRYFPRAAQVYTSDGSQIVATREGPIETLLLLEKRWMSQPVYYRLVTNGFSMSGTHLTAKRYMRSFVYWPMLLHATPLRRVLVVCYGVGVTVGAALDLKSVQAIDVVELSRDVVAMSDLIYPPRERPLADPRVRLHLEDGRYFLKATSDRFDLITGEPPPPLTPGTVNLYTREYFRLIRDRLTEGGFATYWLPVASRGEYDIKAIVRSFCEVFEDCSLWNATPVDWMLMGTRGAHGPVSASQFSSAWADPVLQPHLREIGFEAPEQIGAAFLGGASDLARFTAGVEPLTDDYPQRLRPMSDRLSLTSRSLQAGAEASELIRGVMDPLRARQAFDGSELIRRLWPATMAAQTDPFFEYQGMINRVMSEGADPLRNIAELHTLLVQTSLRRLPLWELGSDDVQQEIAQDANDGSGTVEYVFGIRALVARNWAAAAEYFAESERRGLRSPTLRPLRVYAVCMAGDSESARRLTLDVRPRDSNEIHFWRWLGAHFGLEPLAQ